MAFTFHKSVINSELILDDELFYETKPGLSAFSDNIGGVGKSLNILLQKAKGKIDESNWSYTPLILRATAGLRLLPSEKAKLILEETKRVLNSSGFQVLEDSVSIMDGSDEGIFSWFTVNFLLERFSITSESTDYSTNTVAAFDLGGGSTQVTFAITPEMSQKQSKELSMHNRNIYNIKAFDRNVSVFTQSFLGLGLMAAREAILTHADNNDNKMNNQESVLSSESIELHAECINPIISKVEWIYGGKKYLVNGPKNGAHTIIKTQNVAGSDEDRPIVRFTECLEIIKKIVNLTIPHDLPDLTKHDLYAFSYYFEKAAEVS